MKLTPEELFRMMAAHAPEQLEELVAWAKEVKQAEEDFNNKIVETYRSLFEDDTPLN